MKIQSIQTRRSRPGFTLIEIIVTLAIIATLAGLILGAIVVLGNKGPETMARTEIKSLDTAMNSAIRELGGANATNLPSFLILREDNEYYTDRAATQVNPRYSSTIAALNRAFGRFLNLKPARAGGQDIDWNGDGSILRRQGSQGDLFLQGHHCLVFWTGGIPSGGAGQQMTMTGFSADPQNPALPRVAGQARKGPFMQFQGPRLIRDMTADIQGNSANGFPYYQDAFASGQQYPQPYVYFSSAGAGNNYFLNPNGSNILTNPMSDCPLLPPAMVNGNPVSLPLKPYMTSGTQFANPTGFQIISAGPDVFFGPGGQLPDMTKPGGADNLSNFQPGRLGSH